MVTGLYVYIGKMLEITAKSMSFKVKMFVQERQPESLL